MAGTLLSHYDEEGARSITFPEAVAGLRALSGNRTAPREFEARAVASRSVDTARRSHARHLRAALCACESNFAHPAAWRERGQRVAQSARAPGIVVAAARSAAAAPLAHVRTHGAARRSRGAARAARPPAASARTSRVRSGAPAARASVTIRRVADRSRR